MEPVRQLVRQLARQIVRQVVRQPLAKLPTFMLGNVTAKFGLLSFNRMKNIKNRYHVNRNTTARRPILKINIANAFDQT